MLIEMGGHCEKLDEESDESYRWVFVTLYYRFMLFVV
jgi:hypothetical protein